MRSRAVIGGSELPAGALSCGLCVCPVSKRWGGLWLPLVCSGSGAPRSGAALVLRAGAVCSL